MSHTLNGKELSAEQRVKLYDRALHHPETLDDETAKFLARDHSFIDGLMEALERGPDADGLLTVRARMVPQYTLIALDPKGGDQLGDALLVDGPDLDAACSALIEAHQVEGLRFEVHQGSVRDNIGWKPLPWTPGEPVTDPETEAARQSQ